jgi:hypothetical protein
MFLQFAFVLKGERRKKERKAAKLAKLAKLAGIRNEMKWRRCLDIDTYNHDWPELLPRLIMLSTEHPRYKTVVRVGLLHSIMDQSGPNTWAIFQIAFDSHAEFVYLPLSCLNGKSHTEGNACLCTAGAIHNA